MVYRALLSVFGALLSVYKAVLSVCRGVQVMEELPKRYDPSKWANTGPYLITRVYERHCRRMDDNGRLQQVKFLKSQLMHTILSRMHVFERFRIRD